MARSATIRSALLVVLMMCIPTALWFLFFANQSLRLDEAQSLWQTSRSFLDIITLIAQDVHVPLYHLLLHLWRIYVGDSITAARALSLVLYLLNIPAMYFLGKLAYSRTVGLFGAFLLSISPFMNWYGSEIRMYTLFTFFVILNQYFFIKIFKYERNEQVWAGYILTAILGVFSHYFFFLNLASQSVFYFFRRDLFPEGSFRRFVTAALLILVCFAPWALYVWHLGEAGFQQPLLPAPNTVNLFSTFSQFLFGFQNDNINTFFLSLWPISIIFAFLSLRQTRNVMQPETEYFLATLLVSLAIAFFGSFIVAPIFVSRYLIFTVPSLYLLLASLFSNYSPRFARLSRWSLAVLMVAMLAGEIINPTAPVKENYEQATQFLSMNTGASDSIILSAPFTVYPVSYYYRGVAPIATLPIWNQYAYGPIPAYSESTLPAQVQQLTQNSRNAYVLLSYDQGYEKNIKDYFDQHYQRLYERNFSNDLNLYVYKIKY